MPLRNSPAKKDTQLRSPALSQFEHVLAEVKQQEMITKSARGREERERDRGTTRGGARGGR